jgi:hypothetical protein
MGNLQDIKVNGSFGVTSRGSSGMNVFSHLILLQQCLKWQQQRHNHQIKATQIA